MDWGAAGVAGGGFAAVAAGTWATARWLHRHVIWPLRAVLGVSAHDSMTGEEVPSMPMRLASMERTLNDLKREVVPNGGSSISDRVKATNSIVGEVSKQLTTHLEDAAVDSTALHDHLKGHD